ncbi:MAG: BatD family protein [Cyclobacteriaceae bacterium]|nr:BatD family protein [Cyclobacteriaceae bacterium HetDA_MAG_MS6]
MKLLLSCITILILSFSISAQEIRIDLGPDQVAVNQYFTITLTVENERLKNYSPFPEIPGFVKRGTSSSSSTNFINGQMTSSQSIIQNYQPTKEGNFRIPAFTMTVNSQEISSPGKVVKVGPAMQQRRRQRRNPFDPFDDLFNNRSQPTEFIDVQADAFLALTTGKSEVYVGEGFTTTLAFYVAETNRADMRFYDLGKQITEIVKQIKPTNCWEENFNIDNINGEPVTVNNRTFTQYKIFQATYYPLNTDPISFPSVPLKLIKYKVAKNPSFFGRNRQEDFETFYSKAKTITIKELPPHPLKESVAVGNYRLQENLTNSNLKTGQSFNYSFDVLGEGNISAIEAPAIPTGIDFDFYAPNVKQNIKRANNSVRGTKAFSYYAIPNEPGEYDLGDFIYWIYFDPKKEEYDTLRSRYSVNVSGESRKNEYILSNDLGSFYDRIEFEDNNLTSLDESSFIQIFANIFILAMFAISAILVFKK